MANGALAVGDRVRVRDVPVAEARRLQVLSCTSVAVLCACLCAVTGFAIFGPRLATAHDGSSSGGMGASAIKLSEEVEKLRGVIGWLSVGLVAVELVVALAMQPERSRSVMTTFDGGEGKIFALWLAVAGASFVVLGFVVPAALAVGHPAGLLMALPFCAMFGVPILLEVLLRIC